MSVEDQVSTSDLIVGCRDNVTSQPPASTTVPSAVKSSLPSWDVPNYETE